MLPDTGPDVGKRHRFKPSHAEWRALTDKRSLCPLAYRPWRLVQEAASEPAHLGDTT